MAYLDFANFWFVSSIIKGNNSFFISTYEIEKYMSNFCFPLHFLSNVFPGKTVFSFLLSLICCHFGSRFEQLFHVYIFLFCLYCPIQWKKMTMWINCILWFLLIILLIVGILIDNKAFACLFVLFVAPPI
jgi:hypothetical protein